jgi:hypothetical protein
MGYTHYWRIQPEVPGDKFDAIVADFKELLPALEAVMGVKLAGLRGKGKPKITKDVIAFNGPANCSHKKADLGITWPAKDARGVAKVGGAVVAGGWFAGAQLGSRACGGDCSHESMVIERIYPKRDDLHPEDALKFNFCKTAYKPYDLAVTALLIIAKHHLNHNILVSSDGQPKDWLDARRIVKHQLGHTFAGLDR